VTASTPPSQRLVEMTGIRKSFGGVAALNGIDLHVDTGEIVALLGDNGAGKSTLIKMLSASAGRTPARSGSGARRSGCARPDAINAGIETIFQGSALVDELSVSRNLFLGREPTQGLLGILRA
jgi:simple sugar transport system ATP-binding protein